MNSPLLLSRTPPLEEAEMRTPWSLVVLLPWMIGHGSFASAAATLRVPLTVTEEAGVPRTNGPVTSGVPFPMGALRTNESLRLVDEQGREVPLQSRVTATWRDGSVKWVLLDFQADVAASDARKFNLEAGEDRGQTVQPRRAVRMEDTPTEMRIDTGSLHFSISKEHFGLFDFVALGQRSNAANLKMDENRFASGLRQSLTLAKEFAGLLPRVLPPEEVTVEEAGPWRAVVKVSGWIDDGSTNRLLQYVARVQAVAGSASAQVNFTITQLSDRIKMLWVRDLSLSLKPKLSGNINFLIGGQPSLHRGTLAADQSISLTQLGESGYTVTNSTGPRETGFRAPGWVDLSGQSGGVLVGNRFFWQQWPKTLAIDSSGIRLGLYPESEPQLFDWDQGLAKTHELFFDFHAEPLTPEQCAERVAAYEHPLFAIAPASWYCDSKVFGDLQPFDFDWFPDYETMTEASGDQFIKRLATGWRHWGDVYYGGEFKGTNSYTNLEYDMHHNFLVQFARTGLRKYLDTAITMAKHQADIDTNHKTGWQWKHSPRHVEIQAEFGHTFTRGLLETCFLTGNRRCLEVAIELGDFFAKDIRNPRALGNERQIGWALISLLPVYEATWDKKYFAAASNTVERLMAGLEAKGKFSIRWDNRIAFFNGIAATGFIYYHRATGDERVAEAALRLIRRARGFAPEYNGRTLEAIAWAYQRTGEPEWLDFLARTWETTMARQISWNVMELGAPTIFTVHALLFIAQSGLLPKPERALGLTPAQFDTANGMFAHHVPTGEADLYLKREVHEPLELVVIRKGAWKNSGTATLFGPAGQVMAAMKFPKENVLWQRQVMQLPGVALAAEKNSGASLISALTNTAGAYRLALRSSSVGNARGGSYVTWDVITSRPVPVVLSVPEFRGLEFVTPALFTVPRGDGSTIELELAAEGEGFKRAVICDPDGHVAGSVEGFIDLGDRGRYHYKVSANIPPHHMDGLWSVSLQDMVLEKMTGLAPYFSTSRQSFFRPDNAVAR